MRIAVTGARGFIGAALLPALERRGHEVSLVPRDALASSASYAGCQCVVHLANIAHARSEEATLRKVNVEGTLEAAALAAANGVQRFVYLSSIKASGEETHGKPFDGTETPQPQDAYGETKLAAEQGLAELCIDWVALRPVLVYGPGAKGNFAALAQLARSPYPLPLGGLTARRSLLSVDNLVDAVDVVLKVQGDLRRPFVVADEVPISVTRIIAALRKGLGRRPGLIAAPAPLLNLALQLAGRGELYERLARPLIVDARALAGLGWRPKVTTEEGLEALMRA